MTLAVQIEVGLPSDPWGVALWIAIIVFFVLPVTAILTATGFWMLAKIAPFKFVLVSWVKILNEPLRNYLGDIVSEHTREIRDQVMPNGGSSLNDHVRELRFEVQEQAHRDLQVQQDFSSVEGWLLDQRAQLEQLSERVDELAHEIHERRE